MKFFTFIFFGLLFSSLVFADVINVPGDQSTIQAGINAAANGDTVLVAENTYYENIHFDGKAITVASTFILDQDTSHISKTIIDGSQHSHPDSGSVVSFLSGEDTTSILCGFTITGGTGTEWPDDPSGFTTALRTGGGINIQFSGAKICHNVIKNNIVDNEEDAFGAGISAGYSAKWVVIENNEIFDNHLISNAWAKGCGIVAGFNNIKIFSNKIHHNTIIGNTKKQYTSAAGIWYSDTEDSSHVSILEGNSIYNNSVTSNSNFHISGTGVYIGNGGGYSLIRNNTIRDNVSNGKKIVFGNGVMLNFCKSVDVFNNTISSNTFSSGQECRGGGICINSCSPVMINNIIADNTATHGGGIFSGKYDRTYPIIINNTIVNNSASIQGGGLYYYYSYPELINSILWNNSAESDSQIYRYSGLAAVSYSNIQGGFTGNGNIDSDPLFADSLFHISAGSPCIDTGDPDTTDLNLPETDLWGNIRISDGNNDGNFIIDIGVHEVPAPIMILGGQHKPEQINLFQNYPNPFNPVTVISYQLSAISEVDLSIYNILGQKVAALVNKKQPAGTYTVEWNAAGFASGIYFYRLQTESGFVQTKKLLFQK